MKTSFPILSTVKGVVDFDEGPPIRRKILHRYYQHGKQAKTCKWEDTPHGLTKRVTKQFSNTTEWRSTSEWRSTEVLELILKLMILAAKAKIINGQQRTSIKIILY